MSSLELVDTFARSYNYTHQEVLDLELEFVYTLVWLRTEQAVEAESYKEIQQKLAKLSS